MQRKQLYEIIAVAAILVVAGGVFLTRQNKAAPVSASVAVSSSSAPAATPAPSPVPASETNITDPVTDNMFDIAWEMYVTANWKMTGEEPNEYFSDANTLTEKGRYEAFEVFMGVPEIFLADENMEEVYSTSKYPDIVEQYKAYWAEPENAEKARAKIEYNESINNPAPTSTPIPTPDSSDEYFSDDLGYGMVDGTPLDENGRFADGLKRPGLTEEDLDMSENEEWGENGKDAEYYSPLNPNN